MINDVHIFDPIHETSLLDIPAPDQQPGLGFGTSLAPMGDLNGDGFLDFAVGAGLFDEAHSGGGCPRRRRCARIPDASTSSGATTTHRP